MGPPPPLGTPAAVTISAEFDEGVQFNSNLSFVNRDTQISILILWSSKRTAVQ